MKRSPWRSAATGSASGQFSSCADFWHRRAGGYLGLRLGWCGLMGEQEMAMTMGGGGGGGAAGAGDADDDRGGDHDHHDVDGLGCPVLRRRPPFRPAGPAVNWTCFRSGGLDRDI